MPVSITPLLADRLDISEDRARSLLESMLQELRDRAHSDGVQLSELGTFWEEDGTLKFAPSSSLRRRVNHQFEGLSPEDLGPRSARSRVGQPPSGDANEESADRLDPSEGETEDALSDESLPSSPHDETDDQETGDEASIPTLDPIEDTDEPESTDSEESDDPSVEPDTAAPSEEEDEEAEEAAAFSMRSAVLALGSLLLVLLLVGAGWFLYSQFSGGPAGQNQSASTESEPQLTRSAQPSSETTPGAESTTDADDTTDGADTDQFAGVSPGDEDAAAKRWTIVVASRGTRAAAERQARSYEGGFADVTVASGTVDGETRYRVTIGRYASEAAARSALNEHAAILPSDAWTHRLR